MACDQNIPTTEKDNVITLKGENTTQIQRKVEHGGMRSNCLGAMVIDIGDPFFFILIVIEYWLSKLFDQIKNISAWIHVC